MLCDDSCFEASCTDRWWGAEVQPGSALFSLSVSNCCFIRAWKRNPWLHLIKRIGMADPHNQSQSLSNMLHSVTTKLAWRKVNYGPSLCSSAGVFILYCFCSCFHYANMDRVHLTHTAFPFSYSHFLFLLFTAACSSMIHELGVCCRVWCAISGIIKLTINDFCSQTNTCVTQWAAVSDVVHISYVLCPYGSVLTLSPCMKSFTVCFRKRSTFSIHIPEYIYVNANMHALKHMHAHTKTVNMLTHCTHTRHSIHQSFFFSLSFPRLVCSFSLPFHFNAQPRAQSTCST